MIRWIIYLINGLAYDAFFELIFWISEHMVVFNLSSITRLWRPPKMRYSNPSERHKWMAPYQKSSQTFFGFWNFLYGKNLEGGIQENQKIFLQGGTNHPLATCLPITKFQIFNARNSSLKNEFSDFYQVCLQSFSYSLSCGLYHCT